MDGVHDLGGLHGFGPAVGAGGELAYHKPREPRVLAIQMLVGLARSLMVMTERAGRVG